jgi:Zn-finger nucleic acid-binding protein
MQEIKKYDVDIDFCPLCKGVWLDKGEIDKIAKVQNGYDEEHYQKYHSGKRDHDDDDDYYNRRRRKRGGFLEDLFDFG